MGLWDRIRRWVGADDEAPPSTPGLFTARSPGVPTDRGGTTEPPAAPPEDLWDRDDASPAPDAGDVEAVGPDVTEPGDPEAELAAIEELAPPDAEPETPVDPIWDEAAWDDADPTTELPQQVAPAGSTAEEPLFSAYEAAPEPPAPAGAEPDPVPALFDPPEVVTEPAPDDLVPEVALGSEPEAGAQPEPEAAPRGLVVETHPEVLAEEVPAAGPAPADVPGSVTGGDPATAGDDRTVRVHDERLDKRPGPIRMTPSEAIRLAQDGPRGARRREDPEA